MPDRGAGQQSGNCLRSPLCVVREPHTDGHCYNWNRNTFQFDADSVSRAGAPGVFATEDTDWHAFSQEVRAQTNFGGLLDAMVGGYYQSTMRDYDAWTASGGLENSAATPGFRRYLANSKDSQTKGKTFAVFGQLVVRPVDKVEIAAGVRYTAESKDSYFLQPYSHPIRVAQGIFLPGVTLRSNQDFEDWSPEATVTYKPTDDITLYGAYKTAYKSGGFSNSGIYSPNAVLQDFEFDPEDAKGFEAGIKTTWLDRQLRLNLTAYNYKYSNLQLDFFRSDIFAFTTINAGSARTKGIEFEFQVAPRALDGFDLHGSVNYNRARYGDAPGTPCWAGQTRGQGCNLVYVAATDSTRPFNPATDTVANRQNLKGQPTANAPDWTGNLGASYETQLQSGAKLALGLDARYSGSYIATAFGNPFTRQQRYISLDGTISFTTADEHVQFQLLCDRRQRHAQQRVGHRHQCRRTGGPDRFCQPAADRAGADHFPLLTQYRALPWRVPNVIATKAGTLPFLKGKRRISERMSS